MKVLNILQLISLNLKPLRKITTTKVIGMCESDIVEGLQDVTHKISAASLKRPKELQNVEPRLVAVSKTKPIEAVITAYEYGQRHFGENYIQELWDKSNNPEILKKCKDICWHFIGHLQKNKVSKLSKVPGLCMLETLDSERIASAIDSAWSREQKESPLQIMVQVNTSGEQEKSGVSPSEVADLVKYIQEKCSSLKFIGLMTIGQYGYDYSKGPNPDFQCLLSCREEVANTLNIPKETIEISMGMSDDYEHAIELGSTNVRVGSSIFGARTKKPAAAAKPEGES